MNQLKRSYRQLEGMIKQADKKLKENRPNLPGETLAVINGTLNSVMEYANIGNIPLALGLMSNLYDYFGKYLK
ncbi:MAG: hypothetical protein V1886_01890 [archaeon]